MSYISIAISVVLFLITYFGFIQKQADRAAEQEKRMTSLETKVGLFWTVIEKNVAQLLKSPDHVEKDMLMDDLSRHELTLDNALKLRAIVTDEMQLKGRKNGILPDVLILGLLEVRIFELRQGKHE